jgi:8-oxo-dGTP pyrophosphatase MutT (NUDIX family)
MSAATVAAKPASTVVLARDGVNGLEVFLVQRHGSMGFMGGMHVFPGGKVCDADSSPRAHARFADIARAPTHEIWGDDVTREQALARAVAALRETFEEAGVLVCAADARFQTQRADELRAALHAGADFAALLEGAGIALELAQLQPLSRWITPAGERTRFDTSFYVARAPFGQQAEHDRKESVAADWFTPDGALEANQTGRIRLAPPTALTLEQLRDCLTVDAALARAASRRPPTVLPIIRALGPEVVILYPGDPDHPVREPAFDGPTRRVLRRS